jgi:hypothetical protein
MPFIMTASADNQNVTPVFAPFITIDPIGNHTIGDVFFINGTTNLPVTEPLLMDIFNFHLLCCTSGVQRESPFCPGYRLDNVARVSDFSIYQDLSGPNRFSVNVTDRLRGFVSGDYVVDICSNQTCNAGAYNDTKNCDAAGSWTPSPDTDHFTLYATTNTTPATVPRTILPSLTSIQPITKQTILPISTQSSPLPLVLPIAVLSIIVILRFIIGKKRD